jgi:ribonuclease HI
MPRSEGGLGWTTSDYGFFSGSSGLIYVFLLMLFFSGLILDKMGIRFTGVLACSLMVLGTLIKYYAVTTDFSDTQFTFLNYQLPTSAAVASLGFAVFGVGYEMTGITVSKAMVKWFTGHELALAMGIQAIVKYANTGLPLNIFSDSEISVHGCTKWLSKWYSNGKKSFYLTKNDNQLVANQEIILDIIKMISQTKTKLSILNILGHTDNKDVASMDKFVYYFYRANHIKGRVPIENMQEMAYFNDMVDNISRDALKSINDINHPLVSDKKKFTGFYWYPKEEDIQTYLKLVN